MTIPWDRIEPGTYEDMVSVLLQHLHPNAQRIDGKGGDAGRDLQLRDGGRLIIFELKSFSGRLEGKRRTQVKDSLAKAALWKPHAWTLVVPINQSPAEEIWFDKLRKDYDFPLTWFGLTRLERELADRPSIQRYFLEDAHHEVVHLLTEMGQENAALTGAPDAVRRLRNLHGRLNDIDPLFSYDLSVGAAASAPVQPGVIMSWQVDDTRVDVREQFRGALDQRPITIRVNLGFGADDNVIREQVAQAFDFGEPVTIPEHIVEEFTIDAPAGLGGTFAGGVVTIGPAHVDAREPLQTTAVITDAAGKTVASLPITFTTHRSGQRGVILDGADESGCVTMTLVLDGQERRVSSTYRFEPKELMPAALLPPVTWISSLGADHSVTLVLKDDVSIELGTVPAPPDTDRMKDLVAALAHIQAETGRYFPMPKTLGPETLTAIEQSSRLLKGERLTGHWTAFDVTFKEGAAAELLQMIHDAGNALLVTAELTVTIGGHEVPLGTIATHYKTARLSEETVAALRAADDHTEVRGHMVPAGNDEMTRWLMDRG